MFTNEIKDGREMPLKPCIYKSYLWLNKTTKVTLKNLFKICFPSDGANLCPEAHLVLNKQKMKSTSKKKLMEN